MILNSIFLTLINVPNVYPVNIFGTSNLYISCASPLYWFFIISYILICKIVKYLLHILSSKDLNQRMKVLWMLESNYLKGLKILVKQNFSPKYSKKNH